MKKKFLTMGLPAVLLGGSILAAAAVSKIYSEPVILPVSTPVLDIVLSQEKDSLEMDHAMPGDEIPNQIRVSNKGDDDVYIRITLDKYWTDDLGSPQPETSAEWITLVTAKPDQWLVSANETTNQHLVFYYRSPLAPGSSTSNVLDAVKIGNIPSNEQSLYAKSQIHLKATATAVQTVDAFNAIQNEWGVTPVISANHHIDDISPNAIESMQ